jgi:hypothetical protein
MQMDHAQCRYVGSWQANKIQLQYRKVAAALQHRPTHTPDDVLHSSCLHACLVFICLSACYTRTLPICLLHKSSTAAEALPDSCVLMALVAVL